jgi:hypothetical protein
VLLLPESPAIHPLPAPACLRHPKRVVRNSAGVLPRLAWAISAVSCRAITNETFASAAANSASPPDALDELCKEFVIYNGLSNPSNQRRQRAKIILPSS